MAEELVFVSCDIVAHAREPNIQEQMKRVIAINELVRKVVPDDGQTNTIWASGGDGGHVAFEPSIAPELAWSFLHDLSQWSISESVRLRIVAHYGIVERTIGADGRVQLVGDGINLCGSLLEVSPPRAAIATTPFREFMERNGRGKYKFHDSRLIYVKHFNLVEVSLVSFEGLSSAWSLPSSTEHILLEEAKLARKLWAVLYHSKRILQANSEDEAAKTSLDEAVLGYFGPLAALRQGETISRRNFLASINRLSFRRFCKEAELVERTDGEVICVQGAPGDTMFIVLTGEVALLTRSDKTKSASSGEVEYFTFRFAAGDIIGELALALGATRTATLQAVGRTALLAMSYERVRQFLKSPETDKRTQEDFEEFLTQRVLEYVFRRASYIYGPDPNPSGPLSKIKEPWELFSRDTVRLRLKEGDIIPGELEKFGQTGIYILAAGTLARYPGQPSDRDDSFDNLIIAEEKSFPPVAVDFPQKTISKIFNFEVLSKNAVVLHIKLEPFSYMDSRIVDELILQLRRRLFERFRYDVFISYAKEDADLVRGWAAKLRARGLRVYMNIPQVGSLISPEIKVAIRESLFFVPIVTNNVLKKETPERKNWVRDEIEYRQKSFDRKTANIVPIRYAHEDSTILAEDVSGISAVGRSEDDLIEELASIVDAAKTKQIQIPYQTKSTSPDWPL